MKIALLLSGGVDSSLALKLLKNDGHDVTAFYLKIWLEDELSYLGACPWEEDLSYVQAMCDHLSVPLRVINLQQEYHKRVVEHTIAEVRAGRTPNPDVLCNQFVKFGIFYDAIDTSFEKVATGHYASIDYKDGYYRLQQSPDTVKDQTYFLCNLNQKQLSRATFPLAQFDKQTVRKYAKRYKLPTKNRKDSQGICFLGKFKFRDFLAHHLGKQPGELVEYETQKTVGKHDGQWFYTIGQRQGIRLSGGPWYVVSKDAASNRVYISRTYESIDAPRRSFRVERLRWIATSPKYKKLLVKIRHRSTPASCMLEVNKETRSGMVVLEERNQGIAPGQFAVFYDGTICLGSGIIV